MGGEPLDDLIMRAARMPDPKPYLFQVGQTVRIIKRVIDDGQTPLYWSGAKVIVQSRGCTPLFKTHVYVLKHPNGAEDQFVEEELDRRYSTWKSSTG